MKILQSLNFFPKLYADFETEGDLLKVPNQVVLVQEFVSGQSLFQVVKAKGTKCGLAEDNAKYYFK